MEQFNDSPSASMNYALGMPYLRDDWCFDEGRASWPSSSYKLGFGTAACCRAAICAAIGLGLYCRIPAVIGLGLDYFFFYVVDYGVLGFLQVNKSTCSSQS